MHKQRSFKRRIYGVEDKTLKKKEWVERILKCSSILLFKLTDNIQKKQLHLLTKIKHWQDDHSFCGTEKCGIKYKPLTSNQTSIIKQILESIIIDHSKLNHKYHANSNESFNSAILSFCSKNVNQPAVYPYKIARTGLVSI